MTKLGQFAAACAAVLCGFGAQAEVEVPAKFVEYIESSGDEYIDLGEVLTPTTVATVDYEVTAKNGNFNIFGRRNWFAFITHDWIYTRDKRIVTTAYQGTGQRNVVTIDAGAQTIVANGSNLSLASWAGNEGDAASSPSCLFWAHGSGEGRAKMKLYSCVISNDNQLAVDLHPCVDKDGVAGLYDSVSKTIFRNASGKGAFTASETNAPLPPDYATNMLFVAGAPDAHAADKVSPSYGYYPFLVDGESVTVSAPAAWTNGTGAIKVKCLGYKRYAYDAANGVWQYQNSSTDTSFALSVVDGPSVMIEWQWQVQQDSIVLKPGDDLVAAVAAAYPNDVFELTEGTFEISAPLVLGEKCTVKGAGIGKTTIRQTAANTHLVEMMHADAVLRDCTLTGANFTEELKSGIGVVIPAAGGGTVTNCRITGNSSTRNWNHGIGVDCRSASGVVSYCQIDGNTSGGQNMTFAVYLSAGVMDHCLVADNTCTLTGGIGIDGAATVRWCTITANAPLQPNSSDSYGGGVILMANGGVFENCVIAGNTAPARYVGDGCPEIFCSGKTATFTACVFPRSVTLPAGAMGTPIQGDVLYTDFAGKDYTQQLGSSARDYGCYTPYDYGGELRCAETVSKTALLLGDSLGFTAIIAGAEEGDSLTYSWTVKKPDGTTENLSGEAPTYTPTVSGVHTVSLSVAKDGGAAVPAEATRTFTVHGEETAVATGAELLAILANPCDGMVLTLGAGDYEVSETVMMSHAITIRGAGRDLTTIRMTSNDKQVVMVDNAGAVLEDLAVTGGNINATEGKNGAGVRFLKAGTVRNCRIFNNHIGKNWTHGCGVSMEAAGLVDHCIITGNTYSAGVNQYGGGVYMKAGTLDTCLVTDNSINSCGGGVYVDGAACVVQNCTFAKNYAGSGGGLYFSQAATFRNDVVAGNTSASGDTTVGRPEWAVANAVKGKFSNCLFATGTVTNQNVGGANFIGDAAYKNAAGGDYHPQSSAASIDRGVAYEGMSETDLDGADRVSGKGADIGCYEFDSDAFAVAFEVPNNGQGFVNTLARFNGAVSGLKEGDVVTYAWSFETAGKVVATADTLSVDFTPTEAGRYSVSFAVSVNGGEPKSYALDDCYYACPTVIYVKEPTAENAAAAVYPHDTWATASTNLSEAVEAMLAGGRVELDVGTHPVRAKLTVEKGITIAGRGMDETVVRATHTGDSLLVLNDSAAVVSNLTLTGFYSENEVFDAGAVVVSSRGGTVDRCRITGNRYKTTSINHACGVGIKLAGAQARVTRCIIDRNAGPTSQFTDVGGGVYGTAGLLENCLVCCNTNYSGGGVGVGGTFTVRNCTIVDNVATSPDQSSGHGTYGGGGIFVFGSGKLTLVNSIVQGNVCDGVPETAETRDVDRAAAVTCLFEDPLFRKRAVGDYRLTRTSPAVNAGTNVAELPATDLLGNSRIYRKTVDIGCYENQSDGLRILVR